MLRPLYVMPLAAVLVLAALAGLALAQGLSIDWQGGSPLDVAPDATVRAEFNLSWDGTAGLDVTVSLLSDPPGWTHVLGAWVGLVPVSSDTTLELDMGPKSTLRMWVGVEVPASAAAQSSIFVLRAQGTTATQVLAERSFGVRVLYVPRVEVGLLEPAGGNVTVMPGQNATVRILLRNLGNGEDRFVVSAWASSSGPEWQLSRAGGTDAAGWTPPLPAGTDRTISFEVHAPLAALADDTAQFVAFVTAELAPEYTHPPVQVELHVVFRPGLEVSLQEPRAQTAQFTPGGQGHVNLTFDVTNTGNGADSVAVAFALDDPGYAWAAAGASPARLGLERGGAGTVVVGIDVLLTAPQRAYGVSVSLSSTRGELAVVENATVIVGERHGVVVGCAEPFAEARPGVAHAFLVTVHSTGNVLDAFELNATGASEGWLVYVQPPDVALLPNETAQVMVRVIAPELPGGGTLDRCDLAVRARSTRGPANGICGLEVALARFVSFEWMTTSGPITSVAAPVAALDALRPAPELNPHAEHRRWTAPHLSLRGTGTQPANVTLEVEGAPPGLLVQLDPSAATLPWGSDRPVVITIDVSPGGPTGRFVVNVTARSADGATAFYRTVPVEVTVVEVDVAVLPLNVTGVLLGRTGNGTYAAPDGAEALIEVTIENLGTVAVPRATVRVDHIGRDGVTTPLDSWTGELGPGGGHKYTVRWIARGAGFHRLEATVILGEQSNSTNDGAAASVTVTPRPGADDGAGLGAGTWALGVALAVVAVLGARAYILARGRRGSGGR